MRLIIFICVFIFSSAVSAKQCINDNRTKCAALGFTQSTCPHGGVACPYDRTKWYCANWSCDDGRMYARSDNIYWSDCPAVNYKSKTCYACYCEVPSPLCMIGDVMYADRTCTRRYGTCVGKTPIGVVYMLTDKDGNITNWKADGTIDYEAKSLHGRIVSLSSLTIFTDDYTFHPDNPYGGQTGNLAWGLGWTWIGSESMTLEMLVESIGKEASSELYQGKEKTAAILKAKPSVKECKNGTYVIGTQDYSHYCQTPAASAATAFYPPATDPLDPVTGAGNWYLPTLAEWMHMFGTNPYQVTNVDGNSGVNGETYKKVQATLELLRTKGVKSRMMAFVYWSSNHRGSDAAASMFNVYGGHRGSYYKHAGYDVRASMQF